MERCPLCTAILPAEAVRCSACGKKLVKDKARKRGLGLFGKKPPELVDETLEGPDEVEPEGTTEPFDHTALFGDDEPAVATAEGSPPPPAPEPESFDHSALFAEPGISGGPVAPDETESYNDTGTGTGTELVSFSSEFVPDSSEPETSTDEFSTSPLDTFSVEAYEVEPFDSSALFGEAAPPAPELASADVDNYDDSLGEPFDPGALFSAESVDPAPPPPVPPAPAPPPAPAAVEEAPPLVLAAHDESTPSTPDPVPADDSAGDDDLFTAFAEGFFDD